MPLPSGILYRAINRTEPGWLKINRCLHTKTTIGLIQSSHISAHVQIDPLLIHPLVKLYRAEAEELFKQYRDRISDIMYVYHFHSEVDLICKFDSQQQTMSKQFDIADSAQVELGHLNDRIRGLFNSHPLQTRHPTRCLCEDCDEHRMARASACYVVTYEQAFAKKILSFAWLFSSWLVKLRRANLERQNKGKSTTRIECYDRFLTACSSAPSSLDRAIELPAGRSSVSSFVSITDRTGVVAFRDRIRSVAERPVLPSAFES